MAPGHDISSRATSHNPPYLLSSTTLGCKFVKLAKVLLLNVAMDAFDTSVKVKEEVTVFPLVLIFLDILLTLIRRDDL